ncbi:hypothetical protein MASR1M32_40230 [Rhodobacter sp.]
MSARHKAVKANPAILYHAAERALLREASLPALTALEQMYAYFGSDRD